MSPAPPPPPPPGPDLAVPERCRLVSGVLTLRGPVEALGNWAIEHQDGARRAQAAFDAHFRPPAADGVQGKAAGSA